MTDYMSVYNEWLKNADQATVAELEGIKNNQDEIEFRFSAPLKFGTAGLRGIMCAGINAMNLYTVGQATQGMADLINEVGRADSGVVIAYDSRNNSKEFAKRAACVLAANGIVTYIFDELRPTPLLSFSVRHLNCVAGINITASHNPKEYNGYKAYWEDGAQLSPEHAAVVSKYIDETDIFSEVRYCDFDSAVAEGKIKVIGSEVDERYLECVLEQAVYPGILERVPDIKMVYTPIHGAGYRIVPEVLRRIGLRELYPVPEQMEPCGDFPSVVNPNPEYPEVFKTGIELAKKVNSDLIIATDPDADRVGIMVREDNGEFINFSGNQVGALLLDYIITALEERNAVPSDPYVIKTIVSTEIISVICKRHNMKLHNVLTGFKFIGEVIKNYEADGYGSFILGFEESYGYLKGTYARDKDAVVASMLICEMAAYYKTKGMTLYDALLSLYERYGFYHEKTESIVMKGLDGLEKMKELMADLRENTPCVIGGVQVCAVRDYLSGEITDLKTKEVTPTGLPQSNVLYYELENGDVIVIRPSGTEPKIKIYCLTHGKDQSECEAKVKGYMQTANGWVK